MATSAVIRITQFDSDSHKGSVRQITVSLSRKGSVRQLVASKSGSVLAAHVPPVTQPIVRNIPEGWVTTNKDNWSDSPIRQPFLLYRYRFSFGRDVQELFPVLGLSPLSLGSDGKRWGNMDRVSGILTLLEKYDLSSSTSITLFRKKSVGTLQLKDFNRSAQFKRIQLLGPVEGDADLLQFPFLLIARPEPHSIKNPVDTDVYIRLSNYAFPLSSGTITLYLDDVLQPDLQIEEFFTGLGGFDVTWENSFSFDYDAQVDVRWEFRDTDIPSNRVIITYPFYTVPDSAGPIVINVTPSDETENVPVTGPIIFDIEDFEQDVNINSLVIYVNNILVVDGKTGILEITRLSNEKGYTVKYTPLEPWLYADLIPVAIFIKDTAVSENERFFTFSFTTIESVPPRLINLQPLACALSVSVETNVMADVIDGGHGLDKESIVFTVEEIDRGGQIVLIPIIHRDD